MGSVWADTKEGRVSAHSELICPKCKNEKKNKITNFGKWGLCGKCRHVWGVITELTAPPKVSEKCCICGGIKFRKLPISDEKKDVRKCSKCGNCKDFGLLVEDEKHINYHKNGEPDDKMNITEAENDS